MTQRESALTAVKNKNKRIDQEMMGFVERGVTFPQRSCEH